MTESRPTILLVEDEEAIADAVALNLREEGYRVDLARRGDVGFQMARAQPYDLIVLDLMLPGLDGRDFCRAIRRRSQTPILILSARAGQSDRVLGLEIGADDYLTKPFGMLELLARVKALLRRTRSLRQSEPPDERYEAAGVTLDVARHEVTVEGRVVELRPKEFELLRVLIANAGRVMTRDRLLSLVWGEEDFLDRGTLDVHIRWLRQKIEAEPSSPTRILTVRGFGYRFGA